jgi:hypothetical protein
MVSGGGGSAWENERRKRKMTSGAPTSMIGERAAMKYTYSYTPIAGPKSSPYVLCGIFVGNEEL